MLDTLIRIGKWQAENLSDWARFIDSPVVAYEDRKGNQLIHYVIDLVFDLDDHQIYLDESSLRAYDQARSAEKLMALKIQGGNNKSIYVTASPGKLTQIFKTFFGKLDNEEAEKGELQEALEKDFPQLLSDEFRGLLEQVFKLRQQFINLSVREEKGKTKLDAKYLLEALNLGAFEDIVLICTSIKDTTSGIPQATPIAQLPAYSKFLDNKFFPTPSLSATAKAVEKICYATGENTIHVKELGLTNRFSLNKMFVTETKNYASLFEKDFSKNYQVSAATQTYLDVASTYLLNNNKLQIAGINHVLIPEFLSTATIDLDLALRKINSSAEFLFSDNPLEELQEIAADIAIEVDGIFWLSFFSYDSDGNFFKTTGQIKHVNRYYFQAILKHFSEVNWEIKSLAAAVDWDAANNRYGSLRVFNFQTIYGLIPVRKDKEKKNKALALAKAILERRPITKDILFEYFCELMQCHYYGRYTAYKNIQDYSNKGSRKPDQYFIWACRDSVFKYLAFIQVLKRLKLINMEPNLDQKEKSSYREDIELFLTSMEYTDAQRAMFFLGRMLNAVTYLQKEKKKTALEKVDFNGMDLDDIVRFRTALLEKANQYKDIKSVLFHDASFSQFFDFNSWKMPPQEAVFFLLSGYSYGLVKKEKSASDTE